ncbi:DUF317 domain-containing protein [Streptomyces sp. SID3343]|uniref:DUF317 domain-containing protein n=1 Tax=Streptomyces sp. SID3343 TaxID=2690260 RepID=UPI00136911EF|nr:DUF317 domain-containing protein [Streptomyces sp. SID3343]MYV97316.1 DUF317 domain-containing protein [Streptomyces sp. SID3343]
MTLTLAPTPTTSLLRDAPAPGRADAAFARTWILGAGNPYPVLDLLAEAGWQIVLDHRADIHCASPCGRVYIGYLAESPHAKINDLWHITVEGHHDIPGWEQTFPDDVPSEVVAGFVNALLNTPARTEL